ncbi:hypothetical protein [Goodfellowiella coeruleoviolacea]|uniref:Uncharacterized protein n=1 Tax=Goodfellowiella coeruleoviolacea TaxID=334858 RepID=A0AAE3G9F6_9PSEU|nr:hypothetical protein [Goodfellowiella coeruleoviolacea]MCP2163320.1 hypothetical protein [Goodfellowiella coeruleoviolacea]
MLPAEMPLSLTRVLAPASPAAAKESTTAASVHQGRTAPLATSVAPAVSNAAAAQALHAKPEVSTVERALLAGQSQTGNAAVATAATKGVPVVPASPLASRLP